MKKTHKFLLLIFLTVCAYSLSSTKIGIVERNCLMFDLKDRNDCYIDELNRIYENYGYLDAVAYVKKLYVADKDFAQDCHSYMHLIGENYYHDYTYGRNLKLNTDSSMCGYGFYHGFMIELFKSGVDFMKARDFCDYANKRLGIGNQLIESDCFHGVGHGVTDFTISQTSSTGMEAMIENSMVICQSLSFNNLTQLRNCMNGVYHSVSEIVIRSDEYKSNPLGLCMEQRSEYVSVCLSAFGVVLMSATNEDFGKALAYASKLSDELAVSLVQPMSGYQGFSKVKTKDYDDSILECAKLRKELAFACIKGLMEGVRDFGTPGREAEEVVSFCRNKKMSNLHSDLCLSHAVLTFDGYFGGGAKYKLCSLLTDDEYERHCL